MAFGYRQRIVGYDPVDAKVQEDALKSSRTRVIRGRTFGSQKTIRTQVKRAGLGQKFANALRAEMEPKSGDALEPRGKVFSKAIVKRPGGPVDLYTLFDVGATVQVSNTRYFAIPAQGLGRGMTPERYGLERLRFVKAARSSKRGRPSKASRGKAVAFLFDRQTGALVFTLIVEFTLKKRIRARATFARASKGIAAAVEKQHAKDLDAGRKKYGVPRPISIEAHS